MWQVHFKRFAALLHRILSFNGSAWFEFREISLVVKLFHDGGPASLEFREISPVVKLFHYGGPYHIETSPLISRANQRTGFYIIQTSIKKELKKIS